MQLHLRYRSSPMTNATQLPTGAHAHTAQEGLVCVKDDTHEG